MNFMDAMTINTVEAEIASARAAVEEHRRLWRHQCANGLFGAAEMLEDEIIKTERAILRMVVRREALQQQINEPMKESACTKSPTP